MKPRAYIYETNGTFVVMHPESLINPKDEPGFTPLYELTSPELFAQQIAHAMRYADAPLSHSQFVTLVLHLKARCAA